MKFHKSIRRLKQDMVIISLIAPNYTGYNWNDNRQVKQSTSYYLKQYVDSRKDTKDGKLKRIPKEEFMRLQKEGDSILIRTFNGALQRKENYYVVER
jgi:hypothetical protein